MSFGFMATSAALRCQTLLLGVVVLAWIWTGAHPGRQTAQAVHSQCHETSRSERRVAGQLKAAGQKGSGTKSGGSTMATRASVQ